jgi:hypothetical protein
MDLRQGPGEAEGLRAQEEQGAVGQARHSRLEVKAARAVKPAKLAADLESEWLQSQRRH